uniref:Uncharacterized protein n=1 Tax=Anguilla anguilla TaxID=7936 RepID=A0A0E9UUE6_ANGAN
MLHNHKITTYTGSFMYWTIHAIYYMSKSSMCTFQKNS